MTNEITKLDVRKVEPKHRFDTIMGTYGSLSPGNTMELVVDHDPQCMYYTLKVEHGDACFDFEYLEKGPIDWRVRIVKHAERTAES